MSCGYSCKWVWGGGGSGDGSIFFFQFVQISTLGENINNNSFDYFATFFFRSVMSDDKKWSINLSRAGNYKSRLLYKFHFLSKVHTALDGPIFFFLFPLRHSICYLEHTKSCRLTPFMISVWPHHDYPLPISSTFYHQHQRL